MIDRRSITPIILAAGASTRMGQPKALLDFDGKSALDLVLEAVKGLGLPIVVLGAAREEILSRLLPKMTVDGVKVVFNEHPERGQTSSLKTGLAALPGSSSAFLFHPVDFPLVTPADVARLVATASEHSDKALFIPSHAMRRGHPVLCRRDVAAEFLALPDEAPARDVIRARPERIAHVEFPEAFILMDMDTPRDYAGCLDAYRKRIAR